MMIRALVLAASLACAGAAATNDTAWDVAQKECTAVSALIATLPVDTPLVKLLKGSSTATLFCPSDAAAAAFDFTFLADKANQNLLIQVLENHVVVPGINSYAALEAAANSTSRSVNTNDKGEKLTFTLKHDSPALARVTVTSDSPATANVVGSGDAACHETASKGCVFVVDAILMPSNVADQLPAGTVESAISNTSEYKYFSDAVKQVKGLGAMLGNKTADGITVFVPSNKAMLKFLKLPANHTGAVNFTGTDLEATLQYHVVSDTIYADQFKEGNKNFSTLDGSALLQVNVDRNTTLKKDTVTLHGAAGSSANVDVGSVRVAGNGVLYVIDEVLTPSEQTANKGLTTGAIVAIVIGAVAGLICIAALVYNFTKTRSEHTADGYGQLDP